jgi:hypothetical protein
VSYYTQKSCQNPPVFACHLDDKKTRAPNYHFQLGISDSSSEGAKTIRLAPIVNRLFASSFLPQRGGLLGIYQHPPKLQEVFSLFFAVQSGLHPIRAVYCIIPSRARSIRPRPTPGNGQVHAEKSSAFPDEKPFLHRRRGPKDFPETK